MPENPFLKILRKEAPAVFVYEDERAVAIRDIHPQAPTHILILPRKPIERLSEATAEDESLLGHLLLVAAEVARQQGVVKNGFRLVINNGRDAGESVPHLHVHLLAGRALKWPPG
jgi:histidine triad (HIT) family protein